MSQNDVYKSSTEKIEFLRVSDPAYSKPHFLLVSTKESSLLHKIDGVSRWSVAKFEIAARYLYGPKPYLIGELVSDMGGSVSDLESVRISNGDVMIRLDALRGLHIGSFMFGRVIAWAKTLDPSRRVLPIRLSIGDAHDPRNKERRNKLYENFGIRFNYRTVEGISKAEGQSVEDLLVKDLVEYKEWKNITASNCPKGFRDLAYSHTELLDVARKNRRVARYYRKAHDTFVKRAATITKNINRWTLFVACTFAYFAGKYGLVALWQMLTVR